VGAETLKKNWNDPLSGEYYKEMHLKFSTKCVINHSAEAARI